MRRLHISRIFNQERHHHPHPHQLRHNPTPFTPATMRAAFRLLASVKPGQFLEAGTPTGLTGLLTHPSPRSSLLYHYNATLDKLKKIPESSVYRQSTEALTKHRLAVIEQSKPAGWDQWQESIMMKVAEDPDNYQVLGTSGGQTIVLPPQNEVDERSRAAEWDGEALQSFPEGIRSAGERLPHARKMKGDVSYTPERAVANVKFDPEPQYTAEAYVQNSV
jgi:NADH dehydrogenase (ubiquinone) 1 alpha subcomplex subunit 5